MWMVITSAVENSSRLSTARTPCGSARAWVRFGDQAITVMPNAWASAATGTPRRPSPTTPSVAPDSPGPIVCCQPPARTAASSWAKLRVSAIIIPIVSSGIALPGTARAAHGDPPAAAASRSIEALAIPVVTRSRSAGSAASTSAVNGVRSRIATTMSLRASRSTNAGTSAMWSVITSTVCAACTSDQSALVERHRLVIVQHRHRRHLPSSCRHHRRSVLPGQGPPRQWSMRWWSGEKPWWMPQRMAWGRVVTSILR